MKPSERLQQIADSLLEELRSRATPENFEKYQAVYRERVKWRAIADYLDEALQKFEAESELGRRRLALWTALANVGPGCSAASINALIEQAGLDLRVIDGDSFESIRQLLIGAAREAGLL